MLPFPKLCCILALVRTCVCLSIAFAVSSSRSSTISSTTCRIKAGRLQSMVKPVCPVLNHAQLHLLCPATSRLL